MATYIKNTQSSKKIYTEIDDALLNYFDDFERETLKNYYRDALEKEDPEYAAIINEYRDGLLIFDLMKENIWDKAKNDSLGLNTFFENNKQNYTWEQRLDAIIVNATSQESATTAKELLEQGKTVEEIKNALNKAKDVKAIATRGKFEFSNKALPKDFIPKEGVSQIYVNGKTFTVVKVMELLAPSQIALDEIRGRVLSDYQVKIENDWMKSLRKKYDVKVNMKALKSLKKELDK